jgi:hypothetical protein
MKEVRTAVRDLGREINTMTEAITRARAGRKQVTDVRESYESLVLTREEYTAASGQVREFGAALAKAEKKIREAEQGLADLKQRPDYAREQEIEERIRELDAVDEETGREIAALRTPAVHLFRKAEKVAGKAGDSAAAAAIGRVLDAYTGSLAGDEEDPAGLTEAVMPAILAMIGRRDLALKNQDEVRLFSDPDTLPAGMRRALTRQREVREQRAALQETRAALPGVIEEQHLTATLARLQREREAKAAARARAENQQEMSQASYATECERLRSRAAALAGRDVEVDVPDLPPA